MTDRLDMLGQLAPVAGMAMAMATERVTPAHTRAFLTNVARGQAMAVASFPSLKHAVGMGALANIPSPERAEATLRAAFPALAFGVYGPPRRAKAA